LSRIKTSVPQTGFDRFVPLEWSACALRVRSGTEAPDALEGMMDAAGLGAPSKKKSRSVLKGLWLEPRSDLIALADRGVAIHKEAGDAAVPALSWGMAIAAYPFFGKVAELIGRLTAIQGDCAAAEIHRRMAETYGEREGTHRAANRVIQTQASWGALARVDRGRRLIREPRINIVEDALIAWLIEAAIRYAGKGISVPTLPSSAVLFPFLLDRPLALIIARSPGLELHSEGPRSQLVMLQ
jgi:hypothetical protein